MSKFCGITFKELRKGDLDIFGREITREKRNISNIQFRRIIDYWNNSPLSHVFNQSYEYDVVNFKENETKIGCMACGSAFDRGGNRLERAHILARCIQGSDDISNLHVLCKPCHKESEDLSGLIYWSWLSNKATLFNHGMFTETEQDYSAEGNNNYDFYQMESETMHKIEQKMLNIKNYFASKERFNNTEYYHSLLLNNNVKDLFIKEFICKKSNLTEIDVEEIMKIDEYFNVFKKENQMRDEL